MGDPCSSDTWKKLVVTKANDQWISNSNIKQEFVDVTAPAHTAGNFSLDYEQTPYESGITDNYAESSDSKWEARPATPDSHYLVILSKNEKSESSEERASRLAKMSAYAAQRLANETPEQRAARLKRMSEYAAKRLANETTEQRAKRLARMSAYAAKRLAQETPEQRQLRLARMSEYAAKRHAMKKMHQAAIKKKSQPKNLMNVEPKSDKLIPEKPAQS